MDSKELIKKIIDFGYEYGLFSENDDYQKLLILVEEKIDDLDFIINLYDVILKRVNKNNRIIYKNKKLNYLLEEVDNIRLKLNTDNKEGK